MAQPARVFLVEGEIAAGKTALVRELGAALRARGLRVCGILEPVNEWRRVGILAKFYRDPARYGYAFQTYAFATRVLTIAGAVAASPDADVYLLERSPATDGVFWALQAGVVDPVEAAMYPVWCAAWQRMLPVDLAQAQVLFLRTSPAVCRQRLADRDRAEEMPGAAGGGVSAEYAQRLRTAHEVFLLGGDAARSAAGLPPRPFPREAVREVPAALADRNFRDPGPERDSVIATIIALMGL